MKLTAEDKAQLEQAIIFLRESVQHSQYGFEVPRTTDINITERGILFKHSNQSFIIPFEVLLLDGWQIIRDWLTKKRELIEYEKTGHTFLFVYIENNVEFQQTDLSKRGVQILSQLPLEEEFVALIEIPGYFKHTRGQICKGVRCWGRGCMYSFDHIRVALYDHENDVFERASSIYNDLFAIALRDRAIENILK